jgi:hypothetical protein
VDGSSASGPPWRSRWRELFLPVPTGKRGRLGSRLTRRLRDPSKEPWSCSRYGARGRSRGCGSRATKRGRRSSVARTGRRSMASSESILPGRRAICPSASRGRRSTAPPSPLPIPCGSCRGGSLPSRFGWRPSSSSRRQTLCRGSRWSASALPVSGRRRSNRADGRGRFEGPSKDLCETISVRAESSTGSRVRHTTASISRRRRAHRCARPRRAASPWPTSSTFQGAPSSSITGEGSSRATSTFRVWRWRRGSWSGTDRRSEPWDRRGA